MRHVNALCRKQWICTPPAGFIKPEWNEAKKEVWTTGACAADKGDVGACNTCVAPLPKESCEFE